MKLIHPEPRFIEEVVLNRCYNPTIDFEVVDGMNVMDAGANVGVFTMYAALRTPHGVVVAVEPDSENFRFLTENIAANHITNVIPLRAAVASEHGQVRLGGFNPGNMTITAANSTSGTPVLAMTFDEIISESGLTKIDFAKIDIEGAEFLLFQDPSWLRNVRRVAMEVHPAKGDLRSLIQGLRSAGYVVQLARAYDKDALYLFAQVGKNHDA